MAEYNTEDELVLEPCRRKVGANLDDLKILTEDKETYIKQAGLDPKYVFSSENANEIKNKHNALVDYAVGFPTEEQIQAITDTVVAKLPADITDKLNEMYDNFKYQKWHNVPETINSVILLQEYINKNEISQLILGNIPSIPTGDDLILQIQSYEYDDMGFNYSYHGFDGSAISTFAINISIMNEAITYQRVLSSGEKEPTINITIENFVKYAKLKQ